MTTPAHAYRVRIFWSTDDDCYIAHVPEWPSVSGFGPTRVIALTECEVSITLALSIYQEEGWEVPEPRIWIRAPYSRGGALSVEEVEFRPNRGSTG